MARMYVNIWLNLSRCLYKFCHLRLKLNMNVSAKVTIIYIAIVVSYHYCILLCSIIDCIKILITILGIWISFICICVIFLIKYTRLSSQFAHIIQSYLCIFYNCRVLIFQFDYFKFFTIYLLPFNLS